MRSIRVCSYLLGPLSRMCWRGVHHHATTDCLTTYARQFAAHGLRVEFGSSQAVSCTCAKAMARRPGCHMPATAATSDKAAQTPIAGAKPALKAWAEPKPPVPVNTATTSAIPDTPPRERNML